MVAVALPAAMSPAQRQGWLVLLDLAEAFPTGWCLLGGQMVWLLATERGVDPPRATDDVDVVVDIRSEPDGIRELCLWLESSGFDLEGISPEGIGHRYVRAASPGPGRVIFDVLAPDNVGERANLSTTKGARTLEVPGSRVALNNAERVQVSVGVRVGWVYRPKLTAAIAVKAAATTITSRFIVERDFADAAFLLSLIPDPVTAAEDLSNSERRQLRMLRPLTNAGHQSWTSLGAERARLGQAALDFLLRGGRTTT